LIICPVLEQSEIWKWRRIQHLAFLLEVNMLLRKNLFIQLNAFKFPKQKNLAKRIFFARLYFLQKRTNLSESQHFQVLQKDRYYESDRISRRR
jgi:hypothetical protein